MSVLIAGSVHFSADRQTELTTRVARLQPLVAGVALSLMQACCVGMCLWGGCWYVSCAMMC